MMLHKLPIVKELLLLKHNTIEQNLQPVHIFDLFRV